MLTNVYVTTAIVFIICFSYILILKLILNWYRVSKRGEKKTGKENLATYNVK